MTIDTAVEAEALLEVLETALRCGAPKVLEETQRKLVREWAVLKFEEDCRRKCGLSPEPADAGSTKEHNYGKHNY